MTPAPQRMPQVGPKMQLSGRRKSMAALRLPLLVHSPRVTFDTPVRTKMQALPRAPIKPIVSAHVRNEDMLGNMALRGAGLLACRMQLVSYTHESPEVSSAPQLSGSIAQVANDSVLLWPALAVDGVPGVTVELQATCTYRMTGTVWLPAGPVVRLTLPPCGIGQVVSEAGGQCEMCSVGTWSPWLLPVLPLTHTCLPCPEGHTCPGGAALVTQPGWWRDSTHHGSFVRACVPSSICPGSVGSVRNTSAVCSTNHRGRYCAECVTGTGAVAGQCSTCPNSGLVVVWAMGGALMVLLVCGAFAASTLSSTPVLAAELMQSHAAGAGPLHVSRVDVMKRRVASIGKVLASHCQVLSIVAALNVTFPVAFSGFVSAVSTASGAAVSDMAVPIDCMLPGLSTGERFYVLQMIALVSPAGIAACLAGFHAAAALAPSCVGWARSRLAFREAARARSTRPARASMQTFATQVNPLSRQTTASTLPNQGVTSGSQRTIHMTLRQRVLVTAIAITHLLYPMLVRRGAMLFACDGYDDVLYLDAGDDTSHISGMMSLQDTGGVRVVHTRASWLQEVPTVSCNSPALLGLRISYVLAMVSVPLIFGALLVARIKFSRRATLSLASAFAAVGYKQSPALLQAWECVVLVRKLSVLLIVTLLRPAGLQVQLVAGVLLLVASLAAHLRARPNVDDIVQDGETLSLVVLVVALAASQLFYVGGEGHGALDVTAQAWLSGVLVAMNATCLLYLLGVGVRAGSVIAHSRLSWTLPRRLRTPLSKSNRSISNAVP